MLLFTIVLLTEKCPILLKSWKCGGKLETIRKERIFTLFGNGNNLGSLTVHSFSIQSFVSSVFFASLSELGSAFHKIRIRLGLTTCH